MTCPVNLKDFFFFFLLQYRLKKISIYQQHIFFWSFVIVQNCVVNKSVYPFGLNLFFQPGLGPGFFLTLDSSGAFGLRLLFKIAPFRALEGKLKRITPELLLFSMTGNDKQ